MQQKTASFLRIPRRLVSDKSMKSSDVRVMAVLMDMRTNEMTVEDGLTEISARTGLTERTLRNVLDRLEKRGFLSRTHRGPFPGLIQLHSSVEQFVG